MDKMFAVEGRVAPRAGFPSVSRGMGIAKMDEHEMWWNLRRILYRNTMSYAETEIIRDWLQGFPKVIRVLQSKSWDPDSQAIVDAFQQWYDRWWESGVFKQQEPG
jgi:hypothetical protein